MSGIAEYALVDPVGPDELFDAVVVALRNREPLQIVVKLADEFSARKDAEGDGTPVTLDVHSVTHRDEFETRIVCFTQNRLTATITVDGAKPPVIMLPQSEVPR